MTDRELRGLPRHTCVRFGSLSPRGKQSCIQTNLSVADNSVGHGHYVV
jgi:hypothetical protein